MYAPNATASKSRKLIPLRDASVLLNGLVMTPMSELLIELADEESRGGGTALVGVGYSINRRHYIPRRRSLHRNYRTGPRNNQLWYQCTRSWEILTSTSRKVGGRRWSVQDLFSSVQSLRCCLQRADSTSRSPGCAYQSMSHTNPVGFSPYYWNSTWVR